MGRLYHFLIGVDLMDLKSFLNLLLKNTPFVVMGKGEVNISVSSGVGILENAHWKPHWKIEKYHGDVCDICPENLYEVVEFDNNCLLNEGITEMLKLVCGLSATAFNSANAYLGVGDGTTAAVATQEGLQGANKTYRPMDPGYPQVLNQTMTFRATYGANVAAHGWKEFSVSNSSDDTGKNICRKSEDHSVKPSADTWCLSLQVTLS